MKIPKGRNKVGSKQSQRVVRNNKPFHIRPDRHIRQLENAVFVSHVKAETVTLNLIANISMTHYECKSDLLYHGKL